MLWKSVVPDLAAFAQGGIGKTTISTYVVRQEGTRKRFAQVVWVALGQDPNIDNLHESMHVQLIGRAFDGQLTLEEKQQQLKLAMVGKTLLLVLDVSPTAIHLRTDSFCHTYLSCGTNT